MRTPSGRYCKCITILQPEVDSESTSVLCAERARGSGVGREGAQASSCVADVRPSAPAWAAVVSSAES